MMDYKSVAAASPFQTVLKLPARFVESKDENHSLRYCLGEPESLQVEYTAI